MPDTPSKFQKDLSITFRVILLTHRQTNRQRDKVRQKHNLLGGGNNKHLECLRRLRKASSSIGQLSRDPVPLVLPTVRSAPHSLDHHHASPTDDQTDLHVKNTNTSISDHYCTFLILCQNKHI